MKWKQTICTFLRSVAPDDLDGVPIYPVSYRELATFEPRFCSSNATAWTSMVADLLLSEYLRGVEQWQGRGFGFAIDLDGLGTPQRILGAALHELAHWLDQKPDPIVDCPEIRKLFSLKTLAKVKDSAVAVKHPDEQPATWYGHELRFIRASCHLAHRAGKQMESLRPSHLRFAGLPYFPDAFNENVFFSAFTGELGASGSIRQILSTPEPIKAKELWEMIEPKR